MDRYSTTSSSTPSFSWVLGAAAIGAAVMYLLDPEQGNRRRMVAKEKIRDAGLKTRDTISATSRDLGTRAQGLYARTSRILGRDSSQQAGQQSQSVQSVQTEL